MSSDEARVTGDKHFNFNFVNLSSFKSEIFQTTVPSLSLLSNTEPSQQEGQVVFTKKMYSTRGAREASIKKKSVTFGSDPLPPYFPESVTKNKKRLLKCNIKLF